MRTPVGDGNFGIVIPEPRALRLDNEDPSVGRNLCICIGEDSLKRLDN